MELDAGERLEELPVAASSASGMEPRNAGIAIPTNPRARRHDVHRSRRVRTPLWRSAWWSMTTAPPSSTPCRLGRSSRGDGGRHDKPSKPNSGAQTTADSISEDELREVGTSTLREIAELAERRTAIDVELGEAVHRARLARRSRSKIGAMLDVSKQAAQRKYGFGPTAAWRALRLRPEPIGRGRSRQHPSGRQAQRRHPAGVQCYQGR